MEGGAEGNGKEKEGMEPEPIREWKMKRKGRDKEALYSGKAKYRIKCCQRSSLRNEKRREKQQELSRNRCYRHQIKQKNDKQT